MLKMQGNLVLQALDFFGNYDKTSSMLQTNTDYNYISNPSKAFMQFSCTKIMLNSFIKKIFSVIGSKLLISNKM